CRALVDAYLKRIDAYDKRGPALNAIVVINPNATREADDLDRRFAQAGLTGPLHCIPAIVKDNFETIGLQSAGGSLSLKGFVSNKDAFLVKRIKDAGAIVLAKSNMAEFAFSPYETVNSLLPGYSRNPYALDRLTAGPRLGILRQAYERDTTDPEIVDVFMAAIEDVKRAGATMVDPARVELTDVRRAQGSGSCGGFKYDINRYLAAQADRVPVHTLEE